MSSDINNFHRNLSVCEVMKEVRYSGIWHCGMGNQVPALPRQSSGLNLKGQNVDNLSLEAILEMLASYHPVTQHHMRKKITLNFMSKLKPTAFELKEWMS